MQSMGGLCSRAQQRERVVDYAGKKAFFYATMTKYGFAYTPVEPVCESIAYFKVSPFQNAPLQFRFSTVRGRDVSR